MQKSRLRTGKTAKKERKSVSGIGTLDTRHSVRVQQIRFGSFRSVRDALARVRVDGSYLDRLAKKFTFKTYLIDQIDNRAANILKQEALSRGAEAAVAREVSQFCPGRSSVILGGTERQIEQIIEKIASQPFGLHTVAERIRDLSGASSPVLECRGRSLYGASSTVIFGVLNVTPDSFYDGGAHMAKDKAVAYAQTMIEEGASLIDLGGESSRPGAEYVSEAEEKTRILGILSELVKRNIPVSVDTRKASVAREALDRGACMINDISALHDSHDMADTVRRYDAGIILMHKKGESLTMQCDPRYADVVGEVRDFFIERTAHALQAGIRRKSIVIDPGIGFGKTLEHNKALLRDLDMLCGLRFPVMIGVSRKSLIGMHMKRSAGYDVPAAGRLPGSIALAVMAYQQGARMFRVHDVAQTRQALIMAEGLNRN